MSSKIDKYKKDIDIAITLLEKAKNNNLRGEWGFENGYGNVLNKEGMKRTRIMINDLLVEHERN